MIKKLKEKLMEGVCVFKKKVIMINCFINFIFIGFLCGWYWEFLGRMWCFGCWEGKVVVFYFVFCVFFL